MLVAGQGGILYSWHPDVLQYSHQGCRVKAVSRAGERMAGLRSVAQHLQTELQDRDISERRGGTVVRHT